jgi:hypothetical protein
VSEKANEVSEKTEKTLLPVTTFTIDTLTSDKVARDERQLLRQEFIRRRAAEFKRKVNELPDIPGTFEDDIKENPVD